MASEKRRKNEKREQKCADCIHLAACQAWNVGSIVNALSTQCANYETTEMFLLSLGIEPKEG